MGTKSQKKTTFLDRQKRDDCVKLNLFYFSFDGSVKLNFKLKYLYDNHKLFHHQRYSTEDEITRQINLIFFDQFDEQFFELSFTFLTTYLSN